MYRNELKVSREEKAQLEEEMKRLQEPCLNHLSRSSSLEIEAFRPMTSGKTPQSKAWT